MHGRHHQLQHRVDDRARFLGIEIAHQLCRALDVGEQRGYGVALAVDRCRNVWLLRRDANLGNLRCCFWRLVDTGLDMTAKRGAAVATESLGRFVMSAAGRAPQLQRLATLGTELSPLAVIVFATGATHQPTGAAKSSPLLVPRARR